MRPMLGDLSAAARVLMPLPQSAQAAMMRRMIAEARTAHLWRQKTGAPHPEFGDGSLMACALRSRPGPEVYLDNQYFISSLVVALTVLNEEITQPFAQDTQITEAGSSSRRAGGISSPQLLQKP